MLVEKCLTRPQATTNFNQSISSITPCYATLASLPPSRKHFSSLASVGGGGGLGSLYLVPQPALAVTTVLATSTGYLLSQQPHCSLVGRGFERSGYVGR